MAFGREIEMEFERVKVSPEMVGIASGSVTVLAFMLALFVLIWNLGQSISDLRIDMSDLRVELKGDIAHLNERVARVEGLLEGYIERSRAEDVAVTTE
ncbi:MAG: hypothetical protein OXN23_04885 [Gammaproteobacteria bacterium]|nr:hypothetical protein [Gammaproteobacteria bacterium]MDE0302418.1 hypothetical protein [Gammaproteobacteria bacterium]MDE0611494.1 hypothetical protein [Gammaproteobacteria bacterium]